MMTNDVMQIIQLKTDYEITRYMEHNDFLPEGLTMETARVILHNDRACSKIKETAYQYIKLGTIKRNLNHG